MEKKKRLRTNLKRGPKQGGIGIVTCGVCGTCIGHYVEVRVDGRMMTALAVGGAVLWQGAGWCYFCKNPWYWVSSKRLLLREKETWYNEDKENTYAE